jgi:hypothetical protein
MRTPSIASTQEKRTALENVLSQIVSDGISARSGLGVIWEENEKIYRNEIAGPKSVLEGWEPVHIPFSQPRQDQLVAMTSNIVCTQKPYMLCECSDDEAATRREIVLHNEWDRANFDLVIQELGQIATNTNRAILRVTYAHDPTGTLTGDAAQTSPKKSQVRFSGINFDVIHPANFICLPATVSGVRGAYALGHRFYRTLADVKEMQRLGKYMSPTSMESEIMGGDSPLESEESGKFSYAAIADDPAFDKSHEQVELWDLIVKLPGGSSLDSKDPQVYYRATFAPTQNRLLAFERYPFSRPWYFGFGWLLDQNQFWSGRSVARNLAPLQSAYNNVHTALYNGAMMAAMPPVFGPKPSAEKSAYYNYGEYIEVDGSTPITIPTIQFQGGPLRQQAADIERIGDLVSRVSENMMGATNRTEITATQTEVVASGASAGLQAYIRCFTDALPEAAAFTMELLSSYYPIWADQNPDMAQQLSYEDLQDYGVWTTAGRSPMSTRQSRLASLQMIAQTAMQLTGAGIDVGIQWYELFQTILDNADLSGNDKIQMSQEEMQALQQQQMAMAQEAQMNEAQSGQGAGAPIPEQPGMGGMGEDAYGGDSEGLPQFAGYGPA